MSVPSAIIAFDVSSKFVVVVVVIDIVVVPAYDRSAYVECELDMSIFPQFAKNLKLRLSFENSLFCF